MRKMYLCGRSEAGKTTLIQALKGEKTRYDKTQYVNTWDILIDTPGEYYEMKSLACKALYCYSFECDLEGLIAGADEPFSAGPSHLLEPPADRNYHKGRFPQSQCPHGAPMAGGRRMFPYF